MPAAMHASRSPASAFAVIAISGNCRFAAPHDPARLRVPAIERGIELLRRVVLRVDGDLLGAFGRPIGELPQVRGRIDQRQLPGGALEVAKEPGSCRHERQADHNEQ